MLITIEARESQAVSLLLYLVLFKSTKSIFFQRVLFYEFCYSNIWGELDTLIFTAPLSQLEASAREPPFEKEAALPCGEPEQKLSA